MRIDSSHQSHQTQPSKSTWLYLKDYSMTLSLPQVSEAVPLHGSIWWHCFPSDLFRINSLKLTAWIELRNSRILLSAVRMSLWMAPVCKAFWWPFCDTPHSAEQPGRTGEFSSFWRETGSMIRGSKISFNHQHQNQWLRYIQRETLWGSFFKKSKQNRVSKAQN